MDVRATGNARRPSSIDAIVIAAVAALTLGVGGSAPRDHVAQASGASASGRSGAGAAPRHHHIAQLRGASLHGQSGAGATPARDDIAPAKTGVLNPQRGHGVLVDRGNDFYAWHKRRGGDGMPFG